MSIPPLVAAPNIKQEISMPNIPSSVAQTPAKKRKLTSMLESSTTPRNFASIDVSLPQQPIQNDREEQLSNEQAVVEPSIGDASASESISNGSGDHLNIEQVEVEDSILNSEVYKIYCREKEPEEAMKKIKNLKNCISFQKSTQSIPNEEDFKNACDTALDRLWKLGPRWGDSKIDKVKNFVKEDITLAELSKNDDKIKIESIFMNCLTRIRMFVPTGYEFWYIVNFEKGPRKSKWYRAVSTMIFEDCMLAQLNVIGLTNSTISKLLRDHYPAKKSTKKEWFDFANEFISWNEHHLVDVEGLQSSEKGMFL